jgi:HlyD family secretion protein
MQINKTGVAGTVAALLAVAALVWAFKPRPVEVETGLVTHGPFEQSVDEDGRTRLKHRYTLSAPLNAALLRISLREGDAVQAGDVVAELQPVMPPLLVARSQQQARARLQAADAGITRAQAAWAGAEASVQKARLALQRDQQLETQGFVSPSGLDNSRLAVTAAVHAAEVARADRAIAVQEQAQARAALASGSGSNAPRQTLRAPVSGVVLRVAQQSAASVNAGAALLDIGDPADLEVLSEMLTTEAARIPPGSLVRIENWGGPVVRGKVRRIEPAGFTKVSALGVEEQRVNVLIDVQQPPPAWATMGDGFRVTVRILIRQVPDAVQVPLGALFAQGHGEAVYVLENRHARLQAVEVGARNATTAWVRGGLRRGQLVVVYPPPSLSDGQAVVLRAP